MFESRYWRMLMKKDLTEMPETPAESKIKIGLNVPPTILDEANALADSEGLNRAEFYRLLFIFGLNAYAELSNKRLVNRQLRAKATGKTPNLVEITELDALVEFLKSPEGQQLIRDAIAQVHPPENE